VPESYRWLALFGKGVDAMAAFGTFEVEISNLKRVCTHGSLEYIDSNTSFTSVVTSHFQNIKRNNMHGIYVIRQKSS
jgi:hypothetical protein